MNRANALKLNEEELPLLAKILKISGSEEEQMKEILSRFTLKLAILTFGEKGALMVTEKDSSFVVPPKPEIIVNTVGAGDAFTAAAIMGFLRQNELNEINKHANEVASFVCTQKGAVPNIK